MSREKPTLPREKWSEEELANLDEPPTGDEIPTLDELQGVEHLEGNRYVVRTGSNTNPDE